MKNIIIIIIISVAVITVQSFKYDEGYMESHSIKNKRNALVFPRTSVLQLTVGVSAVMDLLGNPSGQMSYGFQQNIPLPTKFTEILLPATTKTKRSLDVLSELQEILNRLTTNGTECLKQIICQVSETPFEGGLFEEILNFAFTPSNHEDLLRRGGETYPLLIWETVGRTSGNCYSALPLCKSKSKSNPVDFISHFARSFH